MGLEIPDLLGDFERSLKVRRRSPKTIEAYVSTTRRFAGWLGSQGRSLAVDAVERRDIEGWVLSRMETGTPTTAQNAYKQLQPFWKWCVDEGELGESPMTGMSPPPIPETVVPVFTKDDLQALLRVTEGRGFMERRDHCLFRVWISTGARLGETARMNVDDLARDEQAILVTGKGNRQRWVPYSDKTAVALDRYLRERRRHRLAGHGALWLGAKGPMTSKGLGLILERRAAQAGVEGAHPHRFRHDAAHRALDGGMSEGDVMELFGWRSQAMVRRYGASARAERARRAYRRVELEDGL